MVPEFTLKTSNNSSSNFISILDCLDPISDTSSPRRQYEDIKIKLVGKDEPENLEKNLQLITCKSKHEFLEYFDRLLSRFNTPGFKPIILIHGHGDKENGLQFPDKSFLEWHELINIFNSITLKCNGDLTVISGFCYSHNIIKHILPDRKLPFAFHYGYEDTISAGIVENEINEIYKSFIDNDGKYLFSLLSKLNIKMFGEFDYIKQYLFPALMMAANPGELSKIIPNLSQKKIKKLIGEKSDIRLGGIDKIIKLIVRSDTLCVGIVKHYMHNTERQTYVLQAIENYFSLIMSNHK